MATPKDKRNKAIRCSVSGKTDSPTENTNYTSTGMRSGGLWWRWRWRRVQTKKKWWNYFYSKRNESKTEKSWLYWRARRAPSRQSCRISMNRWKKKETNILSVQTDILYLLLINYIQAQIKRLLVRRAITTPPKPKMRPHAQFKRRDDDRWQLKMKWNGNAMPP